MYLLDTDHMSILRRGGAPALRLEMRLGEQPDDAVGTCIVVYEERMRGWLAESARARDGNALTFTYGALAVTLEAYCDMAVLPFDAQAATRFEELRRTVKQVGTNDLKIAAIALANEATLLTRNRQHFEKVPNLLFEDWTE